MKRSFLLPFAVLLAACEQSSSGGQDAVSETDALSQTTVTVAYKGADQVVPLSGFPVVTMGGYEFVRLSDVVLAAFSSLDLSKVAADFESSDGFRPSSKENCAGLLPVPGEKLKQGYISPSTRNLAWDDALQYPGCMRVRDTARITVVDHQP